MFRTFMVRDANDTYLTRENRRSSEVKKNTNETLEIERQMFYLKTSDFGCQRATKKRGYKDFHGGSKTLQSCWKRSVFLLFFCSSVVSLHHSCAIVIRILFQCKHLLPILRWKIQNSPGVCQLQRWGCQLII